MPDEFAPLTEDELAEIESGHIEDAEYDPDTAAHSTPICGRCNDRWPCKMRRLVAEVRRLKAENGEESCRCE